MKPSRYNFFFPYESDDSKLIAYNSFSNAMALVDKDKHQIFVDFCDNGKPINDDEFVLQLKKGRFLVEDKCNELDLIRLKMLKSRFNTRTLNLTIAPTADCNFRCPYCFEKDVLKPEYMTPEIEDALVSLVESHAKTVASLSVAWYGGEPLMHFEPIKRLSKKFMELCAANGVYYEARMITNGYLLTKEICELLNELKIATIQITLDGSQEIHDTRRPYVDGSGTFETIIGNIITCKDVLPKTNLRINVDKDNIESSKEVIKATQDAGLEGKVRPYLGMIMSSDKESSTGCFEPCGFAEKDFEFHRKVNANIGAPMRQYPKHLSNYCAADSVNSLVVAADGKLYKCWIDIGDSSKSFANLTDKTVMDESTYLQYMLFDPTTEDGCRDCKVLPICMGGCPHVRNLEKNTCSRYKFVLDGYLGIVAEKLKIDKDLIMPATS